VRQSWWLRSIGAEFRRLLEIVAHWWFLAREKGRPEAAQRWRLTGRRR
jgi:hypothetical protein